MRILSVIVSRVWVNTVSGRTSSIYGACPWVASSEKANWEVVSRGFTWEMDNNTVGIAGVNNKPTREEAEAFMAEWNGRLDAEARASLPGMIEINRKRVAEAEAEVKEANYTAWKNAAKRRLKEAKSTLAACEARLASLITAKAA